MIEQELGAVVGGARGPDFAALGVELKTVPVTAALVPIESTAVCQIDPIAIAAEPWQTSYVRHKLARVLFVALEVPPGARSVGDRRVAAVGPVDAVARRGGNAARRLRAVRARLLPPRPRRRHHRPPGRALQVRPKGRDASDLRAGYDADGRPTRVGKSGFYLRPAFVGRILAGFSDR